MPAPSYTYTLTNGTTADASQVQQNFSDILNGVSDGTKNLSISALTCAGTAQLSGDVNIGDASGDTLSILASLGTSIPIKTTNSFDIGDATHVLRNLYSTTFLGGAGGFGTPAYSFTGDPNTGLYSYAADAIGFTTNGAGIGHIDGNAQWFIGADSLTAANADHAISGRLNMLTPNASGRMDWKTNLTSGSVEYIRLVDGSGDNCGNFTFNATANTCVYTATSDRRIKKNFSDFNGLEMVSRMKPLQYERISDPGKIEYGFVAQDLYEVLPQAVVNGDEVILKKGETKEQAFQSRLWGVDYGKVTGVLTKAIQELLERVSKLEMA